MNSQTDIIIIGAGIAGVSCGVYAKRAGLNPLIFEPGVIGGQLLLMECVDNYVGVPLKTKGRDLAQTLEDTVRDLDIAIVREQIVRIKPDQKEIIVYTQKNQCSAPALVVATGASFKKIDVKGEEQFIGRGVSYCAVCDGFFFRGKTVAVVGGGNTAVEEALYLSDICRKVYLIHRRDTLRAMEYLQKDVFRKENIEVLFNHTIKEIKGGDFVREIILENVLDKTDRVVAVDGLFVSIGIRPNTDIVKGIMTLDESGFILTDNQMKTSCERIWTCGDCRKRPLKQLITAASEGAISAISVYKYLKGQYISV